MNKFKKLERFGHKGAASGPAPKGPDPMAAIIQENKDLKARVARESLTVQVQADAIATLEQQVKKLKSKAKKKPAKKDAA